MGKAVSEEGRGIVENLFNNHFSKKKMFDKNERAK